MPLLVYVGTYTNGASEGIYTYEMDPATGALALVGLTGGIDNPSFLAVDQERRRLFAVQELGGPREKPEGRVSAFSIESRTGSLRHVNTVATGGGCPCHVVVDPTGRAVVVANYLYGKVTLCGVGEDGGLTEAVRVLEHRGTGPNAARQEDSHPHSTTLSPTGAHAYVADLGADRIWCYALDPAGPALAPADPPYAEADPGAGPRHMVFAPSSRWMWTINEMGNTVTTYAWDAETGALARGASVATLPEGFTGASTTADIHVHPTGRFVYGSNRGHDSIVGYTVDDSDGSLHAPRFTPTGGRTPRSFAIAPGGGYLLAANQESDSITVFAIDPTTGALEPVASRPTPTPVCLRFVEL